MSRAEVSGSGANGPAAGLRARDALIVGLSFGAFGLGASWSAWFGEGARVHVVAAVIVFLAGVPVAVARAPGQRLVRALALIAPGLALVVGADLAAGRALDGLSLLWLLTLAGAWTYALEVERRAAGWILGAAWLVLALLPAAVAVVLAQAAPEGWSAAPGWRALSAASPWVAAYDLARGSAPAPGLAAAIGLVALGAALADARRRLR
ncbi:MAG: hypothetical protein WD226_10745 [Planctomycetota bacterium]